MYVLNGVGWNGVGLFSDTRIFVIAGCRMNGRTLITQQIGDNYECDKIQENPNTHNQARRLILPAECREGLVHVGGRWRMV